MPAQVYGIEHITFMVLTVGIATVGLICAKRYLKSERAQDIFFRCLGGALLVAIVVGRLSQVFRYGTARWDQLIPDSYCAMTSLVLALAVLLGKKDNCVLHFVWHLAIVGGVGTVVYPTFVGQGPTIFYLPTITGLLHHAISATTAIALLLFNRVHITYKKWYYTLFGFTSYLTVGAFLIGCLGYDDAFHIFTPLIDNTPLTTWVMALMYAVGYALILWIVELVRKGQKKPTQDN